MPNSELKHERLPLAWRKKLSLDHLFLENVADDRKPSFKMQYIVLCKKSSLTWEEFYRWIVKTVEMLN